jgi:hypothetical protein
MLINKHVRERGLNFWFSPLLVLSYVPFPTSLRSVLCNCEAVFFLFCSTAQFISLTLDVARSVYVRTGVFLPHDDGVDLLETGRRANEILNLTSN